MQRVNRSPKLRWGGGGCRATFCMLMSIKRRMCSVHRQWAHSADKTHKCRIFQLHEFSLQSSKIYLFSISSTSACPLNMSHEHNRCPCHSACSLCMFREHARCECQSTCSLCMLCEHGLCSCCAELLLSALQLINIDQIRPVFEKRVPLLTCPVSFIYELKRIDTYIFLLSTSPHYRILYDIYRD